MSQNSTYTVRAGVVGVGSMGRHHARVYRELPTVDLVGVFDVDAEQAADVAATHGTRSMGMDELLDAVDAVSIAVPTAYHFDIARECIERGVNVLVEKPFVEDPANGRSLISLAESEGVTIQVGHVERFNPAVMALPDILAGMDVIAIDAQRLGPPPDREIHDSAVMDLMIHDIDVLLSLVDADIASVDAIGARDNRHATANVQFENGVMGSLTASRLTQEKVRTLAITARECRVNVDYTSRSIQIHRYSMPEYIEQNGDLHYRHESIVERPSVENSEPLKNELASFIDATASGEPPVVTAEDGLKVLEIARDIDEQAFARHRTATGVSVQ